MDRSAGGHEQIEHTADLAVRAWAPDLAELIVQAAEGMLDLMLRTRPPAEDVVAVAAEGADAEELLVDCLREILALWTVDGRMPVSVSVRELRDRRAVCEVGLAGRGSSPEQEIKAATYHALEVKRRADGLEVTVVFDV